MVRECRGLASHDVTVSIERLQLQ